MAAANFSEGWFNGTSDLIPSLRLQVGWSGNPTVFVVYLFFVGFLGPGAGPGFPNKKTSIFSLGEITRLMEFRGVVRTFIVKIAVGLPSGETAQLNYYTT